MANERILELLRRPVDAAEYQEIRELWKRHSIAEEHRDLAGLIATLTEDCVYEIPEWKQRWSGHAGVTVARVDGSCAHARTDRLRAPDSSVRWERVSR